MKTKKTFKIKNEKINNLEHVKDGVPSKISSNKRNKKIKTLDKLQNNISDDKVNIHDSNEHKPKKNSVMKSEQQVKGAVSDKNVFKKKKQSWKKTRRLQINELRNNKKLGRKKIGKQVTDEDKNNISSEAEKNKEISECVVDDTNVKSCIQTNKRFENALKKVEFKLDVVKPNKEDIARRNERLVFVGNVPHNVKVKNIQKMFSEFGNVEKVWLRGAVKSQGRIPKKITMRKKLFEENHPPLIAYVLFSSKQEAIDALQMNGILYDNHHLRVDSANSKTDASHNKDKSIFLGNLPFFVKDDEIWNLFQQCGEIESVRIVRDSEIGIGKGFGYVNFKCTSSVELALQMNGEVFQGREIRVSRILKAKTRAKQLRNKQTKSKFNVKNNNKGRSAMFEETSKKKIHFRGNTADGKKKKPKMNKLELKNKILAQKLTTKPKKKQPI